MGWSSRVATTVLAEVFDLFGQSDIADQIFAAVLIDEAAAGVGAEVRHRLLDLVMGDAERLHGREVRRHAILADFAADRDHLGDAGNGEKPRPDDEIGDLAHVHRRGGAVAGQRDQHDFAHDGGDRPHLRIDGSAAADRGSAPAVRRRTAVRDRHRRPSRTRHRPPRARRRRPSARG